MRSSSEQYNNPSGLIDKKIGELYATLELVTKNLTEIKHISFYMPQLFEIHQNIDDLIKLTSADVALNFTNDNIGALSDYFDALNTLITDRDSLDALASEIESNAVLASDWAQKNEDSEVVAGKFSALHHAAKALGFKNEAQVIVDNADTVITNSSNSAITNIETLRDTVISSINLLRNEVVAIASSAATSETNANNAATSASLSSTNASDKANEADTSANNAATSANNSALSATNSALSESNAVAAQNIVSAALTHYILDPDFVNFVNANIGSMTKEQASLIQNTIYRLKLKNIWGKLDFINFDFGIGEQGLLTNLKNPSIIQTASNLVYTPGSGFLGNGTDGWVDTGILPSLADNYSLNSASVGIYSLTATGIDGRDIGTISGTELYIDVYNSSNNTIGRINRATNSISATLPNGLGLIGMDRSDNVTSNIYHNGLSVNIDDDAADQLPSSNIAIFRGSSVYSSKQIPFWFGGSSLTTQEWSDLNEIVVDSLT